MRGVEAWTPHIWKMYGVPKASFYKARAWEVADPGKLWSGKNIRLRGKVALLTEAMESSATNFFPCRCNFFFIG